MLSGSSSACSAATETFKVAWGVLERRGSGLIEELGASRLSGQGCVGAQRSSEGPYITLSNPTFMGGT
jgi:hypothetical protein